MTLFSEHPPTKDYLKVSGLLPPGHLYRPLLVGDLFYSIFHCLIVLKIVLGEEECHWPQPRQVNTTLEAIDLFLDDDP